MYDWLSGIRLKLAVLFGTGLGYVAVALLSWLPAAYRPHLVVVSDKLEHAMAYLLLGALSALAMRQYIGDLDDPT
jgi:VanZ family protein